MRKKPRLPRVALAIAAAVLIELPLLAHVGLAAAAVALVAPLAFAMGMAMPLGLARIDEKLVPWAWGVNGFTSVVAAPLATALGMAWGFFVAGAVGAAAYLVAALLFNRLR